MILVVDNHDSFTFNLVHGLARFEPNVRVIESDEIDGAGVIALSPAGVVLSPGPGRPEQAGATLDIVAKVAGLLPLFGVCLGHQAICTAFGGRVVHAAQPMHGQTSAIAHDGLGLFAGLPNPLTVARYHSLVVDPATLPASLVPCAHTPGGELMAVRHRSWAVEGVQFHPESFLTPQGLAMLERWVRSTRSPGARPAATFGIHG